MQMPKLYAQRSTEDLGSFYTRHLEAMTEEQLCSKSAIAAELAWRDAENAKLREKYDSLREAALGVTGEMTPEQLEYHENSRHEFARRDLGRLYRAATE